MRKRSENISPLHKIDHKSEYTSPIETKPDTWTYLGLMKGFIKKNTFLINENVFTKCSKFLSALALICGEITYTSNIIEIDAAKINSKVFSQHNFWLIFKFVENAH